MQNNPKLYFGYQVVEQKSDRQMLCSIFPKRQHIIKGVGKNRGCRNQHSITDQKFGGRQILNSSEQIFDSSEQIIISSELLKNSSEEICFSIVRQLTSKLYTEVCQSRSTLVRQLPSSDCLTSAVRLTISEFNTLGKPLVWMLILIHQNGARNPLILSVKKKLGIAPKLFTKMNFRQRVQFDRVNLFWKI